MSHPRREVRRLIAAARASGQPTGQNSAWSSRCRMVGAGSYSKTSTPPAKSRKHRRSR